MEFKNVAPRYFRAVLRQAEGRTNSEGGMEVAPARRRWKDPVEFKSGVLTASSRAR